MAKRAAKARAKFHYDELSELAQERVSVLSKIIHAREHTTQKEKALAREYLIRHGAGGQRSWFRHSQTAVTATVDAARAWRERESIFTNGSLRIKRK